MGTNPLWGNLDRALKLIEFYGKRGNTAPSVGFDESNPRLAQLLDVLAPAARPLATVEAPQGIGERLVEQHAPYLPPETKASYAEKIQRIPDTGAGIATEMTSPLNIASTVAGGAAGVAAKGTLGALVKGAGSASLAPPALESMQEMNPEGIATAIIPLAVLARNPNFASRTPREVYRSLAQHYNTAPPYLRSEGLNSAVWDMPLSVRAKFTDRHVIALKNFSEPLDLGKNIPQVKALTEAIKEWVPGNSVYDLRKAAKSYIEGEPPRLSYLHSEPGKSSLWEQAKTVVETIRNAEPQDVRLFRGASNYQVDKQRWIKDLEKGETFDLGLSSFSSGKSTPHSFTDNVFLEVSGPVKRLQISPLTPWHYQGESITFGKFKVIDKHTVPAYASPAGRSEPVKLPKNRLPAVGLYEKNNYVSQPTRPVTYLKIEAIEQ